VGKDILSWRKVILQPISKQAGEAKFSALAISVMEFTSKLGGIAFIALYHIQYTKAIFLDPIIISNLQVMNIVIKSSFGKINIKMSKNLIKFS